MIYLSQGVIKLNNILGPIIKDIRKSKRITQTELSRLTGYSQNTISNHENGKRSLSELDIANYAKAFNLAPQDLFNFYSSKNHKTIMSIYNELNESRKSTVLSFAEKQLAEQNSIHENVIPFSPRTKQQGTEVTIYGAVSAGTGEMLGDGVTTKRCYFGRIPHHDYALTVNGDSMKPMFEDGQIIFVENVEDDMEFLDGQIVIAILNGESYIKKLRIMKNCAQLISLNAKYDPIEVSADDDFKIKGKVIL